MPRVFDANEHGDCALFRMAEKDPFRKRRSSIAENGGDYSTTGGNDVNASLESRLCGARAGPPITVRKLFALRLA